MIHAKDGTEVLENLQPVKSPGTGVEHWGSSYFGPRYSTAEASAQPQKLKPSKRRNWISSHIALSTRPVLQYRREVAWEPVFDPSKIVDELSAQLVRLGGGMSAMGPDPKAGGGYYLFVANGSLELNGETLPQWSMLYVDTSEDKFEIRAGRHGLEALVMQFPRDDD
ncbi:MAG TPA: hypothetical protein VHP37_02125 [Burkholderiales bacterium]|nr:hypothetical protein [Burkholderiales bacterium]